MKTRLLIITILSITCVTSTVMEVYGHGVGPRFNSGFYRVEDDMYSKTTVSVGESFILNGTIVSLVERDFTGNMNIRFDYTNNDPWLVNLLKSNFSCLAKDTCAESIHVFPNQNHWYMDIQPTPDSYLLKGDEIIFYSIEITPLKGGTYHVHTDPDADIPSFRYIGPGETIVVQGSQDITDGELFEFYIPYTIGFVLITIGLIYGIVFIYRKIQRKRK
ncbi:hypothetical protein NZNM25_04420 [Nitrosopumilus zosterae]|uniref:Uncharacterized protein n=1 Tax=Nitrosopumilus zosterae TaxID=718286 RepID=A0A2S2KQ53_9ARCH|nr:hypothetical protein [Nitrosopumilus zosterae]BDQ31444.1 hypothetical protein NZOSNM25_001563 [Nitrosopumilus zosterae]GBH33651.1 hypothetical protein NZNM25_04420 [Nitrosopumilus zosterae]